MKKYVVVEWPEIQLLEAEEGFHQHSYLINDEKGAMDFVFPAYFVELNWYRDHV